MNLPQPLAEALALFQNFQAHTGWKSSRYKITRRFTLSLFLSIKSEVVISQLKTDPVAWRTQGIVKKITPSELGRVFLFDCDRSSLHQAHVVPSFAFRCLQLF